MKVEIQVDASCREPKIVVVTDRVTDEIHDLIQKLSVSVPQMLVGFQGEQAKILANGDIVRVFTSGGKVCAETADEEFVIKLRLYEAEERLDKSCFARISNSEIINLKKVKQFDLSFAGTICVSLSNGKTTYVSRRYVSKIKRVLGI